jgi:hypothetical protein
MTKFRDTDKGEAFVASYANRETSIEIMEAIAFFARNLREAEELWEGDGIGVYANLSDIWENVTGNGLRDAREFCWAENNDWAKNLFEKQSDEV